MYSIKEIEGFPKHRLTSDGRVQFKTTNGWKNRSYDEDENGMRYVILSEWDRQKRVFLLSLKFPRGRGYEKVMTLREEERQKVLKLHRSGKIKYGRHHRSLDEMRMKRLQYGVKH